MGELHSLEKGTKGIYINDELSKFLFDNRRLILEHMQYLYGPGFTEESPMRYLRTNDLINLFLYSQENYGMIDQP